MSTTGEENIKVCCRFRPLNEAERATNCGASCIEFSSDGTGVTFSGSGQTFAFDKVFRTDSSQRDVYNFSAKPIIDAVLCGFNGTVFVYGQTASGKTHTMQGPDVEDPNAKGVSPRMVYSIFDGIYNSDETVEFVVKVSIIEIYNERIKDLLDPEKDNLRIHEDKARGVFIGEVTELYVVNEQEILEVMKAGNFNRAQAVTNMNEHSSRSHLVFILTVEQRNLHDQSMKVGKLHLVDLAGSESVAKSGASGDRLDEAKNINRSLSALGNVIMALSDKRRSTHVPYRDSKLTRVLQESLGGNSKTSLIVMCSPSMFNAQETLSTLRFGQRAKLIRNVARVNVERSAEELKALIEKDDIALTESQARINMLEQLLKKHHIALPASAAPSSSGVRGSCEVAPGGQTVSELLEQLQETRFRLKETAETVSELNRERLEAQRLLETSSDGKQQMMNEMSELQREQEGIEYEKMEKADEIDDLKRTLEMLKQPSRHNSRLPALAEEGVPKEGASKESRKTMGEGEKINRKKLELMEAKVTQLSLPIQDLLKQKEDSDASIRRLDQRIAQLGRQLGEARPKYELLLARCANLTKVVDFAGGGGGASEIPQRPRSSSGGSQSPTSAEGGLSPRKSVIRNRKSVIVRPLRGGVVFKFDATEESPEEGKDA